MRDNDIRYGNLRGFLPVPALMRGKSGSSGPAASKRSLGPLFTLASIAALAACKPPPESRHSPDAETRERGLAAIERAGCGACHDIPGVEWPKGQTGPSLAGFDDVGLIAGTLPNTPENLAEFVRDAPAVKPGTAMPAMPLSPAEARDVAGYLYGIDDA